MAPKIDTPRARPRLASSETRRLVVRAKRGDREAKSRLVDEHMRVVRAIAQRYRDMGLPVEDLIQEGVIGLLEAIDRFDPENGAAFSTYAFWRVRQSITHALTDQGRLLRLPKDVVERRSALAKATSRIVSAGRAPTVDALAALTRLSPAQVVEALAAPTSVASLDAVLDEGGPLEAAIADPAAPDPESEAQARLDKAALAEAVAHLPARKRAVIEAHFGLTGQPQTLAEIGDALDVSPARARALERDALYELAAELEPIVR